MLNKAVVVGALVVIGRCIVEKLVDERDWQVAGLSRREATNTSRYRHIAIRSTSTPKTLNASSLS